MARHEIELLVTALVQLTMSHPQEAGHRQLADAAKAGLVRQRRPLREDRRELPDVRLEREAVDCQERLHLGGEHQHAVMLGDEQRALAEAVAREEQAVFLGIVDGEAERAVETPQTALPPLQPGLQHHLGIRLGVEHPALRLQLGAQLAVVVQLAVETDPVAAGRVAERLGTGREIDDAQPHRAHRHVVVHEVADLVRAAMMDSRQHRLDEISIRKRPWAHGDESGDAAHRIGSLANFGQAGSRPLSRRGLAGSGS